MLFVFLDMVSLLLGGLQVHRLAQFIAPNLKPADLITKNINATQIV